MQPENITSKAKLSKKRLIIIISIIIIFLLAAIGIIILKQVAPNNSNTKKANSSANVITAYAIPKTIAGLSSNLYQQQVNGPIGFINIPYKLNGYNYGVNTKTTHYLTFAAINKDQKDDSKTIQDQTATFMKQNGLDVTKNAIASVSQDISTTTYSNDKIVCQLTDMTGSLSNSQLRYHTIACVDISAIKQEYLEIEKMLTIYKKSQKLPSFTFVFRTVAIKDNISYSIIDLTAGKSYPKLLFTAVDNVWIYIGDLSVGDAKYDTGKYIITPDIQAKISDPKYKGFIVSEIH